MSRFTRMDLPVRYYELRIVADEDSATRTGFEHVVVALPEMLKAVEEDLTDLLPEGWRAQIRPAEPIIAIAPQ